MYRTLKETKTFASQNTGEVYRIRHSLTCDSTNVIYLLQCNACVNSQYVGQTSTTLKKRITSHRFSINTKQNNLVSKHFNQPNHSLHNMTCIALEQVFTQSKEARLRREQFSIQKLRTLTPAGLNVSENI